MDKERERDRNEKIRVKVIITKEFDNECTSFNNIVDIKLFSWTLKEMGYIDYVINDRVTVSEIAKALYDQMWLLKAKGFPLRVLDNICTNYTIREYSTIATDCNGDKYVVDKVYDALEDLYKAIEIYKKSENTYRVYFFV